VADTKIWREIPDGHVAHSLYIAREDVRLVRVEQQRPKDAKGVHLAAIIVYVAGVASPVTFLRDTEEGVNSLLTELGVCAFWRARG
jgi:hypothetical protein